MAFSSDSLCATSAWFMVRLRRSRGMISHPLFARYAGTAARRRPDRNSALQFFHFYAACKGLLNVWRRRPGRNACDGWRDAAEAIARARKRDDAWHGPPVEF